MGLASNRLPNPTHTSPTWGDAVGLLDHLASTRRTSSVSRWRMISQQLTIDHLSGC